jgi:hypothetical protein
MYRIQLDPGPWSQYVKRADNIGLPLTEVSKKYQMETNLYANQLFEALQQQQQTQQSAVAAGAGTAISPSPSVTPSVTPSISITPSITPSISVTPSVTPSISITPSISKTPSITPTPSPTGAAYRAYNYSISGTDTALATGNTGGNAQYNGKVVVVVTGGYNCGNTTPRNFTVALTAGSYISWVCSPSSGAVPVLGYYANDTLITSGLVSTQTLYGACPC